MSIGQTFLYVCGRSNSPRGILLWDFDWRLFQITQTYKKSLSPGIQTTHQYCALVCALHCVVHSDQFSCGLHKIGYLFHCDKLCKSHSQLILGFWVLHSVFTTTTYILCFVPSQINESYYNCIDLIQFQSTATQQVVKPLVGFQTVTLTGVLCYYSAQVHILHMGISW